MLKNACSSTFPLANRTAKANQSPLDKYSIQRIIFYSQFFKAQWQIMIYTFDVTSCFRSRGEATPRMRPSQSSQKDLVFWRN